MIKSEFDQVAKEILDGFDQRISECVIKQSETEGWEEAYQKGTLYVEFIFEDYRNVSGYGMIDFGMADNYKKEELLDYWSRLEVYMMAESRFIKKRPL